MWVTQIDTDLVSREIKSATSLRIIFWSERNTKYLSLEQSGKGARLSATVMGEVDLFKLADIGHKTVELLQSKLFFT